MTAKTLTIGELAKASATTPRTLRHFEALGLIKPARAENGRRVYTLQTISTLARIFLLKRMGFSLAEIRSLELKPASPKDIIGTQLSLLSARMTVLERTISQLRTTHNLISGHLSGSESQIYDGPMDLVAFCLLLRERRSHSTTGKYSARF
ncbi:MerR family transcriptional regulator [Gluconobacter cerinus]|uniref:MerR family transcriptional regulator n=1 Tax=Gluconobacter cerinus TaxID=38307 RepID=UPI002011A445|nr:MerR family transcriptional regulator [Gluconobacter cerinus]